MSLVFLLCQSIWNTNTTWNKPSMRIQWTWNLKCRCFFFPVKLHTVEISLYLLTVFHKLVHYPGDTTCFFSNKLAWIIISTMYFDLLRHWLLHKSLDFDLKVHSILYSLQLQNIIYASVEISFSSLDGSGIELQRSGRRTNPFSKKTPLFCTFC